MYLFGVETLIIDHLGRIEWNLRNHGPYHRSGGLVTITDQFGRAWRTKPSEKPFPYPSRNQSVVLSSPVESRIVKKLCRRINKRLARFFAVLFSTASYLGPMLRLASAV
ncbi:unnamed protein product [Prunus armeniaca]|uniref:Uncharacterized protein n=1 Tax=Prunus armeniaca TaxID=36596 RepID=A0A6J5UCD2_PRUAR|nr:unnamed protein product [Prunus armeniaca]